MKKLWIEELAVDSFVVSPAAAGGRGTVRGLDSAPERTGDWSCGDRCPPDTATDCTTATVIHLTLDQPTCVNTIEEYSCVVDICQPTFAYSCIETDCGV